MIKNILNKIKQIKNRRYNKMYNIVRSEWVKFFETRHQHLKQVEFLPCILADEQMAYIEAAGELTAYYKRIKAYSRKQVA